ncbi:MAG: RNA-binding protein [Solirubrobacterales bacterium]|jgi:ribosome-associated heat shock protein Hsp15|nr:RNA-binding protein [Solirubrobacterales bacterium]
MSDEPEPVRVDKWMWAARLVKTRALAVDAIKGGRVSINGQKVKPSRDVRVGDRLEFSNGPVQTALVIRAIASRRGPATEAALLYDETAESAQRRAEYVAQRRAAPPVQEGGGGRPTKRDRRRFDASRGRERD